MNCPKCSEPLPEGESRCPDCDASSESQSASVNAGGKGSRWAKWITVIALALVIGSMAWFTFSPIFFGGRHLRSDNMAKSCLRNLINCQEQYYVDHETYSDDLAVLGETMDCFCDEGVEVDILKADERGYIAQASHVDSDKVFMVDAYESMDIHLAESDSNNVADSPGIFSARSFPG